MSARPPALQTFIDLAETAFRAHAGNAASVASIDRSFNALRTHIHTAERPSARMPTVNDWLEKALSLDDISDDLRALTDAFWQIEPLIQWRPRTGDTAYASDSFADGHANAMIVGPGGIEARTDVWIGASLLAPHVRYPDHTHAPEETYLVLTPGEFSQGDGSWFEPGAGGSFYNRPGILHAMRAGELPLFAFWLLRAEET